MIISNIASNYKSILEKYYKCQTKLSEKFKITPKLNLSQEDDTTDALPTHDDTKYQLKIYGRTLDQETEIKEQRAEMFERIESDVTDLRDMMQTLHVEVEASASPISIRINYSIKNSSLI